MIYQIIINFIIIILVDCSICHQNKMNVSKKQRADKSY